MRTPASGPPRRVAPMPPIIGRTQCGAPTLAVAPAELSALGCGRNLGVAVPSSKQVSRRREPTLVRILAVISFSLLKRPFGNEFRCESVPSAVCLAMEGRPSGKLCCKQVHLKSGHVARSPPDSLQPHQNADASPLCWRRGGRWASGQVSVKELIRTGQGPFNKPSRAVAELQGALNDQGT